MLEKNSEIFYNVKSAGNFKKHVLPGNTENIQIYSMSFKSCTIPHPSLQATYRVLAMSPGEQMVDFALHGTATVRNLQRTTEYFKVFGAYPKGVCRA